MRLSGFPDAGHPSNPNEGRADRMMKRTIALALVLLVGLPWSVLPAGAGSACGPGAPDASASCSYCSTGDGASVTENLHPGCCRYTPRAEAAPIQASGISASPPPNQSPDAAVAVADFASPGTPDLVRADLAGGAIPPIPAPPTATTHLLI